MVRVVAFFRIPAVILLLCEMVFSGGPIRVDDAFESGSLGTWRVADDTRLIFVPRTEYDQDHVNSAVTWFYGRLSNVLHREVSIQIEGLDYTVYAPAHGGLSPVFRQFPAVVRRFHALLYCSNQPSAAMSRRRFTA